MSNLREDIALRLTEERGRLGYSKANLAHIAEISNEQLRLYELGRTGMPVEFLARIFELGFDIQYITVGVRARKEGGDADTDSLGSIRNKVKGNVQNSVLAGDGATVTQINTQKHITRTKAEVKPGINEITTEQARTLQDKVNEVVEWEGRVRQSPKTHRAVWSALNRHCGVATYREIKLQDYEKAYTYLSKWLGRLRSSAKAKSPANNGSWRKACYAAIHAKIKEKNIEAWYRAMLQEKYGVTSSTALSDENLKTVYRSVSRKNAQP